MNILAFSKRTLAARAEGGHHFMTVAHSAGELTSQFRAARPDVVLIDRQMTTTRTGGALLGRLFAEDPNVPILIVVDIDEVKPDALERAIGLSQHSTPTTTSATETERVGHALAALHHHASGRADARRVAEFLGLSHAELARILSRSPQSVHKTPDAPALQEKLSVLVRIATALSTLFGTADRGRVWLNAPHPDLDQARPIELIKKRKPDVVADLLEDALLGHPS